MECTTLFEKSRKHDVILFWEAEIVYDLHISLQKGCADFISQKCMYEGRRENCIL